MVDRAFIVFQIAIVVERGVHLSALRIDHCHRRSLCPGSIIKFGEPEFFRLGMRNRRCLCIRDIELYEVDLAGISLLQIINACLSG